VLNGLQAGSSYVSGLRPATAADHSVHVPLLFPLPAVIISYFDPASVGNLGLMTIPCIVFYIMQLFIDSFIANTWASKYERFAAVEAAYNEQLQQLEGSPPAKGLAAGAEQLSSKVAAKLSAGGAALGAAAGAELAAAEGSMEADRLIGTSVVVAGSAARPSRAALINRRSSASDGEEAGLMQNVELNDVNPLAEGHSAQQQQQQQQQRQQPGGRSSWR